MMDAKKLLILNENSMVLFVKANFRKWEPHGSQCATNYEQVKGQLTHL